ncbi:unnamed protein product [Nezara viridula]|uniref:AMOP domain-containing protein n=1 Tax=Nezara viridula TaxID=85310 RepID=A0A9P0HLH3_NEZVI|nr:unnamed protein product [Nezara viridula]
MFSMRPGDEVQKILLNTRTLTVNLPYSEGNETGFPLLEKETGETIYNSTNVVIGLKISQAREDTPEEPKLDQKTDYDFDINLFTDELKINFGTAVSKLIGAVSGPSKAHLENSTPCEKLLDCRKHLQDIFLGPLPSCPCNYPTSIFYEDKIWDEPQKRFYRWKDASGDGERLHIYKPNAEYCIRSLLAHGSTSLAAQHCCYNRQRKLITRGSGAGNPNYVSPDISRTLHEKIDLLPWKLCKGDFTRYNKMRPPNNGNTCEENPKNEEYEKQVRLASFY